LTELIEQHFGFLELYLWFATNTRWHETSPEKASQADIWCARLQTTLRVFFVSIGTLGLRRFGGRANFVGLHFRNTKAELRTHKYFRIAKIFETNRMGLVPGPGSGKKKYQTIGLASPIYFLHGVA